jgi:zinc protease
MSVSLAHHSQRLENGLSVVTHRDESSPVVTVALVVAAGAADDPAGREGLAHAVEHLAFRSEHSSGPSMRLRLNRMGASFNAWTASEATLYLATAPKSELTALVQAFADIARNPVEGVTRATLDTERGVLDNERRFRDENGAPGEVVDRLRALVYGTGRLGKSIGGTGQSLRAMTVEDTAAFASAHYSPSAMTVAISGSLGDANTLLAPFAALPVPSNQPPVSPVGLAKAATLDEAGIEHVLSSVPSPELWLGWRLPGAYGPDAATMEIISDMASAALATGAWDRHSDVTAGHCFLDRGKGASMLACRAYLSSANDLAAVKSSLVNVIRKGIATRASERDWRYIYTRSMATRELLDHEPLSLRTHELALGAHFAKDPGFSLKRIRGIETAESDALMALYDRTLTTETTRAVLAAPGTPEQVAALPLTYNESSGRGAEIPDPERLVGGVAPIRVVQRVLANRLRVLVVQREHARFQTALLGFFDGAARVPPAVVDAARWSYRSYIVEPPRGVLQAIVWDEDATHRIVRGPAGDARIPLHRLAEGLDNYDFKWKNEGYIDFSRGAKQRENDPRESTPRSFRKQLFFDHPYGAAVVSSDVDAVTVRQIRDWYDAVHRPENALLVLVGPESPEVLFQAAAEELGGWQRSAQREPPVAAASPLRAEQRPGQRLIVGHRPTESQVTLEVGCVLPPGTPASAPVEEVLAHALDETLDESLRQRAGATYGVSVWIERLRGGTRMLHARSAVANEQLGPSLQVFYSWFAGDADLLTEDLVKLARFDAVRSHVARTETSVGLASTLFDHVRCDLPPTELTIRPELVAKVTLDASRRLLTACRATALFSAVGDERRIRGAWQLREAASP